LAVIHTDHTLGDGAAKNSLLKSAKGSVFILIDPSVEATGPFLSELGKILLDPKIGIAGYAGLRTETMLHFHEGDGESGFMDAIQGYCLAFRREDIANVGLMRESFRFYRNLDIDFSFQFKNVGFRIYADNSLPLVLHEHRGWTSLSEQERDELSRKNYGRFLKKWREKTNLLITSAN
jgi:GT2 family glycosyltransferase